MKIELKSISKRFNYEWIFRNVSYTFESGGKYAIKGQNGSGKSTLLKIISGQLSPSEGMIEYSNIAGTVSIEQIYQQLTFTAPYLDLMDDLTLEEALRFHSRFKPFISEISISDVKSEAGLSNHSTKQLKQFSSGMRQRVKLILSILSDSPILLLDEPTTNLDESGVNWYHQLIQTHCDNRLVIVCSNQEREYYFCTESLRMQDYKGF